MNITACAVKGKLAPDCYYSGMFDRIMENSMAIWMLISLAFPIFLFGTLIKAFRHYRRSRKSSRPGYAAHSAWRPAEHAQDALETQAGDWVPSR